MTLQHASPEQLVSILQELNEGSPEKRDSALQHMKIWLISQPHLPNTMGPYQNKLLFYLYLSEGRANNALCAFFAHCESYERNLKYTKLVFDVLMNLFCRRVRFIDDLGIESLKHFGSRVLRTVEL
jgi:hypothetical protein